MNILRVALLALAVGLSSVLPAISQGANTAAPAAPSAEAIAVAKELMALVSGDMIADLTGKMVAQTWPTLEQSLRVKYPKLDAATSADLRAEFEKQIAANIAESMNDAPAIYARYLSVPEMRDIEAFYRTPTGAKALKLMPQITAEVMGQFLPRMQGMMDRVNTALTAVLQKHGYTNK
ncbi:MAG TPA: DUF2059 domain-containing protein [Xanthobacteraceae bacterium]|nr:DUF2059 domain-containing protein [Xanthobacteraceae bacterium]